MYRLIIKRSAERDLRRLPRPVFLRMNQRILSLRDVPHPTGSRKLKGARNDFPGNSKFPGKWTLVATGGVNASSIGTF